MPNGDFHGSCIREPPQILFEAPNASCSWSRPSGVQDRIRRDPPRPDSPRRRDARASRPKAPHFGAIIASSRERGRRGRGELRPGTAGGLRVVGKIGSFFKSFWFVDITATVLQVNPSELKELKRFKRPDLSLKLWDWVGSSACCQGFGIGISSQVILQALGHSHRCPHGQELGKRAAS